MLVEIAEEEARAEEEDGGGGRGRGTARATLRLGSGKLRSGRLFRLMASSPTRWFDSSLESI